MKTAVTSTSRDAYHSHKANKYAGQHSTIVAHMDAGKIYSRRQIARMTGLETSAVAGRCNEMLALGILEVCGKIHCPITGKLVEAVRRVSAQMGLM